MRLPLHLGAPMAVASAAVTALVTLSLYSGFVASLIGDASASPGGRTWPVRPLTLCLAVIADTLSFMTTRGVVFTTLLRVSLTTIFSVVSPIIIGVLLLASLVLSLDLNLSRLFPKVSVPASRNRVLRAFLFGAIVLPCNPGFIAFFFARVATDTGLIYLG